MKSTIALLLCSTAAATVPFVAAQATSAQESMPGTVSAVPAAESYADLLTPITDAVVRLRADDAALAAQPQPRLQLAQYHHHHHHHHHHHYGPGFFFGFGGPPAYYAPRHCYWTWGRAYWNGWRWVRPRVRVCD